jgi:hypothetical protein
MAGLCHALGMKNKNQRELQKYWAKEATKQAKPSRLAAKKKAPKAKAEKPAAQAQGKDTVL